MLNQLTQAQPDQRLKIPSDLTLRELLTTMPIGVVWKGATILLALLAATFTAGTYVGSTFERITAESYATRNPAPAQSQPPPADSHREPVRTTANPSAPQVASDRQSGGVTAGSVGTINQTTLATDATQPHYDSVLGALKAEWVNYKLANGGVSVNELAGTELPPDDWMNRRLSELGEDFRVKRKGLGWTVLPQL